MGRQRGILRLFILLFGTQCPVPDTWSLARKPVPLGMGVGHPVNKEHRKFLRSLPPTSHTHPCGGTVAGVWRQWEPMSHGGRQDNVSPKRLPLAMSGVADVGSCQAVTPGMTLSSGQLLALPWMTWVFFLSFNSTFIFSKVIYAYKYFLKSQIILHRL